MIILIGQQLRMLAVVRHSRKRMVILSVCLRVCVQVSDSTMVLNLNSLYILKIYVNVSYPNVYVYCSARLKGEV